MRRTVMTGYWESGRYFYGPGEGRRWLTTTPHWMAGRIGRRAAEAR
jgi:hypothetical protein